MLPMATVAETSRRGRPFKSSLEENEGLSLESKLIETISGEDLESAKHPKRRGDKLRVAGRNTVPVCLGQVRRSRRRRGAGVKGRQSSVAFPGPSSKDVSTHFGIFSE